MGIRSLSLEHKLPLFIVALLLVILVTSLGVTYRVLTRSAEASASERLGHAVVEVAETAATSIEGRLAELRTLAADPRIRALLAAGTAEGVAAEAAGRALREHAGEASGTALEVRASDGRRLAAIGPDLPVRPSAPTDLEAAAGPMFEVADGTYTWSVAPVVVAGRLLGFVARSIRVGGPREAVQTVRDLTGEVSAIYVRNADGAFWAPHPALPPEMPERLVAQDDGSYVWPGLGAVVVEEAPIPNTPWVAVMATPVRLVHARARSVTTSLGFASLALLGLGALVVWLFSRSLTRPLTAVTRAAEAITAGDFSRRVAVDRTDELGRLAASFNHMAAEVEASRRELIQRVREAQEAGQEAEHQREIADGAREQAERASRAKSDFLAVMSHELRTPLNAIGGYAQLLEMGVYGDIGDAQREALRRIARNNTHLLTLINDVLNYARIDAGSVQYEIADLPLATIMNDLEQLIGPQIRQRELRVIQRAVRAGARVRADPDKVQQILLNLLSNAIKFTPDGGLIGIECDDDDERVRIHVRDTGIGIAPDRLQAVFDPFYQGENTLTRPADGVGLGLAISRDLARGMAGELTVASVLGEGSVFTLVLPRGGSEETRFDAGAAVLRPLPS